MEALSKAEKVMVAEEMRGLGRASEDERKGWRFQVEADRYEKCGEEVVLFHCEHDQARLYSRTRCRSRVCDHCGTTFYGKIADQLQDIIATMLASRRKGFYPCLITLSPKKRWGDDRLPNREEIKRVYRESSDFFRLFASRYRGKFTRTGKVREDRKQFLGAGSISTMEVGRDNNNLHVHAVVYMPFTPLSVLKRAWARITGDSVYVNLKPIKGARHATNYILKYITKPPATDSYHRLAEYAWMIKGTRRLRTGGMFYNQVRTRFSSGLKHHCPFCHGRIRLLAMSDMEATEEPDTWPLWKLVRESEDLGRPLMLLGTADHGRVVYRGSGGPSDNCSDMQKGGNRVQVCKKVLDSVQQPALF